MGADSTLVNAAFREAETRAGANVPNLKPLYESTVKQGRQSLDIMTGVINKLKKDEHDLKVMKDQQAQGLKKTIAEGWSRLHEQKENLPDSTIEALRKGFKDLQAEFDLVNTIGEGDTQENEMARSRINGVASRLINSAINTRAAHMTVGGLVDTLDVNSMDHDKIAPLEMVANLKDQDKRVAAGDMEVNVVDGVITYTVRNYYEDATSKWGEDVTMNAEQFQEYFPQKNIAINAEQIKQHNENASEGTKVASGGGEASFDRDTYKSRTDGLIKTVEDLQYLMKNSIEGIGGASMHEDLLDSGIIQTSVVESMFIDSNGEKMEIGLVFAELDKSGPNGTPDGKIDKNDLVGLTPEEIEVWTNNSRALIDAITNTSNPAFNYALSKEMYLDYQADREEQNYMEKYDAEIERKRKLNNKDTSKGFKFNVLQSYSMIVLGFDDPKWVSGQLIDTMQKFISNPTEGQVQRGYDGNIYSYKDGKFYVDGKLTTQSTISKNLGIWDYGYTPEDTYSALPPPDESEEAKGVPFPSKEVIFKDISKDTQSQYYIKKLEETYKDYPDFKFERTAGGSVLITAPDGTEKSISTIDRFNFGREKEARNEIQAFIAKHASTKQ